MPNWDDLEFDAFQYIKCDGSAEQSMHITMVLLRFQYIKCDGSALHRNINRSMLAHFNTSNVMVQR